MIISAIPGIIGGKASEELFILSLIVTGTGTGGFKSNISPLVAEQYRRTKPFIAVTKSGERVIVDPVKTASRIYMVGAFHPTSDILLTPNDLVFLPLYQHWRTHRTNQYGLCRKGKRLPRFKSRSPF